MDRQNIFLASTLANDPHTEGIHNAGRIARMAGIRTILLEPSDNLDIICNAIKENRTLLSVNTLYQENDILPLGITAKEFIMKNK